MHMLKPPTDHRRRVPLVFAVTAIALVGASCGGGSTKAATGTSVPTPVSSTTTAPPTTVAPTTTAAPAPITAAPPATVDPGLAAKAQGAVYQLSDFPDGWEAVPPSPTDGLQIDALWSDF